ncbi:hypothetical protein BVG81_005650, partial [Haliangium sp. UPWRP_2]
MDAAQRDRVAKQAIRVIATALDLDHPGGSEQRGGLGWHIPQSKLTDPLDRCRTELLHHHSVPRRERVHRAVVAMVCRRHRLGLAQLLVVSRGQSQCSHRQIRRPGPKQLVSQEAEIQV